MPVLMQVTVQMPLQAMVELPVLMQVTVQMPLQAMVELPVLMQVTAVATMVSADHPRAAGSKCNCANSKATELR